MIFTFIKIFTSFLILCVSLIVLGLPFLGLLLRIKALRGFRAFLLSMLLGFHMLFLYYFVIGVVSLVNSYVSSLFIKNLASLIALQLLINLILCVVFFRSEIKNMFKDIIKEIRQFASTSLILQFTIFLVILVILTFPEFEGEYLRSYIGDVAFHHAYFNSLVSGKIPPFVNAVGCYLNRYPYFYHFILASFSLMAGTSFELTMKILSFLQVFLFIIASYLMLSCVLKEKTSVLFSLILLCIGGGFGWINVILSKDIRSFTLPIGVNYFEYSEELLYDMAYTKSYLPAQHLLPPAYPRDFCLTFFILFLYFVFYFHSHIKQNNTADKCLIILLFIASMNLGIQLALHTQLAIVPLILFIIISLHNLVRSLKRRLLFNNLMKLVFTIFIIILLPILLNIHWIVYLLDNYLKYGGLIEWDTRFYWQKPFPTQYLPFSLGIPFLLGILGIIVSQFTIDDSSEYVKIINLTLLIILSIVALQIIGLQIPLIFSPDGKDIPRYMVLLFCLLGIYSGTLVNKLFKHFKRTLIIIIVTIMLISASLSTVISSIGLYNAVEKTFTRTPFPNIFTIVGANFDGTVILASGSLNIITRYNPEVTIISAPPNYCRVAYKDLAREYTESYFIRLVLIRYINKGDRQQVKFIFNYLSNKYNVSYILVNYKQFSKLSSLNLIEETPFIIYYNDAEYYLVRIGDQNIRKSGD